MPRKAKQQMEETPPDSPEAVYDKVIYLCLKQSEPVMWMPVDHKFADNQTVVEIAGFDPAKKMTLQKRAKVNNYLVDETQPPQAMSIFCRVERGTDQARINDLLKNLNARFKSLTYPQKSGVKAALLKNWGEKMMRRWTYTERDAITNKITYNRWNEVGTRGSGTDKLPQTTDQDSDDDFRPRRVSGKGAKKAISSSSEGGKSPDARRKLSGVLLQNPFFTPGEDSPGTSRTSGIGSTKRAEPIVAMPGTSKDSAPGTSKDFAPTPSTSHVSVDPKLQQMTAKVLVQAVPEKKTRKRIQQVSESDSGTLTPSPSKKLHLQPGSSKTSSTSSVPGNMTLSSGAEEAAQAAVDFATAKEVVYDLNVPKMDVQTYTEAVVISEEQLDNKIRAFLTDYERGRAQSEPFKAMIKAVMKDVIEEVVDPKLWTLRDTLSDVIVSEITKVIDVLANKATKTSITKVLEAINSTKTTIEDFSIEQVRIRNEIGNIQENVAEKESRSCGILGRFLPFDLMGQGFDLFLSSHYVQSKVVPLIKDELAAKKGNVNVRIAFAFTNVFLTRIAMAHLVWRHPKNPKKILFYKRKVPDAVEKIIKADIIPFVRTQLEVGNEVFLGNFSGVKKVMSTRFANARTKQLELAFSESANPDSGLDALQSSDNEYYIQNTHAIPSEAAMEDRDVYKRNLMASCAECKNAFDEYQDREALGKSFKEEDDLFDSLRGNKAVGKVFTNYEIIQGIIAAARADGLDVTKLTFDQPKNFPDVRDIYKRVLDDNIADLDNLLKKFPVDTKVKMPRTRSDSEKEEELKLNDLSLGNIPSDDSEEPADAAAAADIRRIVESSGEEESPSELEKNIECVTLGDDDEPTFFTQREEKKQKPATPEAKHSWYESVRTLPSGIKQLVPSSQEAPSTSSQTTSQTVVKPDPPKQRYGPYSPGGTPLPLPPLPKDPYARPRPFEGMTNEQIEERLRAAHRRKLIRELEETERQLREKK